MCVALYKCDIVSQDFSENPSKLATCSKFFLQHIKHDYVAKQNIVCIKSPFVHGKNVKMGLRYVTKIPMHPTFAPYSSSISGTPI
jgi:hypothetical protein